MSALPNDPVGPVSRATLPPSANRISFAPSAQVSGVPHTGLGGRGLTTAPPGPYGNAAPFGEPARADALLLVLADELDGIESLRVAMENRFRAFVADPIVGPKGGAFGKGMGGTDVAARMEGRLHAIRALEHEVILELQRAMRVHPLGPWVKETVGVGLKQAARLLGAIGDPGARRTVSQLWAYCGLQVLHPGPIEFDTPQVNAGVENHSCGSDPTQRSSATPERPGGVAPKRVKGVKANWSNNAKVRAILIANSCIKQARSPYRAKYDARRARTAETHPDWTLGHSHNDAIRVAAKEVLKDLWRESRRLQEEGS